ETLAPEPAAVIPPPPPAPAPIPVPLPIQPVVSQPIAPPPAPVVPPPVSPVPVPTIFQGIDAAAVLRDARASIGSNDIEGGLKHYETLVRANVELENVSTDLTKLIEKVKNYAALFRVLGDSLMRQGKLQAALDTYRKALNQL
ncbi:MAG TPA: hypothetical protein VHO69_01940, partial [Phototrophicaceae bacterium]|nr:hypothetical protein [Phototrophicaceae bacterium]